MSKAVAEVKIAKNGNSVQTRACLGAFELEAGVWHELVPLANGGVERIVELEQKVATLEKLRPFWAQGFNSTSVAAQTLTSALAQVQEVLGTRNQTETMQKLRALVAAPTNTDTHLGD